MPDNDSSSPVRTVTLPQSTPTSKVNNTASKSSSQASNSSNVALGAGLAVGILCLAILGIWIFKKQVSKSEEFKNRLNRPGSPQPAAYEKSIASNGSAELERQQPYGGYDADSFEYNANPEGKPKYALF